MKLLLIKVLALTLATTSKDVLAQTKNQDENVASLRGSVSVVSMLYDMMYGDTNMCSVSKQRYLLLLLDFTLA